MPRWILPRPRKSKDFPWFSSSGNNPESPDF
jgi:hypothetical protein